MRLCVAAFFLVASAYLALAQDLPLPELKSLELPTYPVLARNARAQGTVELTVTLNDLGEVRDASVISGHAMLRAAAAANVKSWKFDPSQGREKTQRTFHVFFRYKIRGMGSEEQRKARVTVISPNEVEIEVPPPALEAVT